MGELTREEYQQGVQAQSQTMQEILERLEPLAAMPQLVKRVNHVCETVEQHSQTLAAHEQIISLLKPILGIAGIGTIIALIVVSLNAIKGLIR